MLGVLRGVSRVMISQICDILSPLTIWRASTLIAIASTRESDDAV
jgi:hypothetical protein